MFGDGQYQCTSLTVMAVQMVCICKVQKHYFIPNLLLFHSKSYMMSAIKGLYWGNKIVYTNK